MIFSLFICSFSTSLALYKRSVRLYSLMIGALICKVESKIPASGPEKQFSGKSPQKVEVVGLSHQIEEHLEIRSYCPWVDILNIKLLFKMCILPFTPLHVKENIFTRGELPAQLFIWNSMTLVWLDMHTALNLSGNVAELGIFLLKVIWDLQSRLFQVSWDSSTVQLLLQQHHVQSTFLPKKLQYLQTQRLLRD